MEESKTRLLRRSGSVGDTRGAVPEWTNQMAEMSWQYWLTYNGFAAAADISLPTLFVHSDDCVLPANVRRLASIVKGSDSFGVRARRSTSTTRTSKSASLWTPCTAISAAISVKEQ